MNEPLRKEVSWQEISLIEKGANGLHLKYNWIVEIQGKGFMRKLGSDFDLQPHDDLVNLMKSLRPIVAKVESYDYARKLLSLEGFEATEIQQQSIEASVQQEVGKIDVTGIKFSTKKKDEGVIINYDFTDENEQTTKRHTSWINLGPIIYGIEEDLKEIVDKLKIEAFRYEYEDKYADFEQMSIEYPEETEEEENDDGVTDVEPIEEDNK